jgi:hypothetical protein
MSKTIYKYPLRVTDDQHIQLPSKAVILSVGLDPVGDLCLWALVDQVAKHFDVRRVVICGTGKPCNENRDDYVASVVQGPFVWHVFIAGHYHH